MNGRVINSFWTIIALSSLFGLVGGFLAASFLSGQIKTEIKKISSLENLKERVLEKPIVDKDYLPQTSQEQAIVNVVKEVSPSVVSIIITKDLPILEEFFYSPFEEFGLPLPFQFKIPQFRQKGTEKREIGGGTGFIVSEDGLLITNKHVVLDESADYTVLTNEGQKFPGQVLAKDPFQDLAVLKIKFSERKFKPVKLGDSAKVQVGQTVIAIGNALGEFRNTVSVGVVSGLERRITATGGGFVATIENLIQTDAAINRGNSGGPLLNLKGEVIGVNTAMAQGAENIGFAIPINRAKRDIDQVKKFGKISYPFLGVCWTQVTSELQQKLNLPFDYGALIQGGQNCPFVIAANSAAQKANLKEGDIILEWQGKKLTLENNLGKVIQEHNPGDRVLLKIFRQNKEFFVEVVLTERTE